MVGQEVSQIIHSVNLIEEAPNLHGLHVYISANERESNSLLVAATLMESLAAAGAIPTVRQFHARGAVNYKQWIEERMKFGSAIDAVIGISHGEYPPVPENQEFMTEADFFEEQISWNGVKIQGRFLPITLLSARNYPPQWRTIVGPSYPSHRFREMYIQGLQSLVRFETKN